MTHGARCRTEALIVCNCPARGTTQPAPELLQMGWRGGGGRIQTTGGAWAELSRQVHPRGFALSARQPFPFTGRKKLRN